LVHSADGGRKTTPAGSGGGRRGSVSWRGKSDEGLGECGDDFLDGLGSEAEAQQIRGEAVGRKVGAAGLGGDEIVVGEVEEGDKN